MPKIPTPADGEAVSAVKIDRRKLMKGSAAAATASMVGGASAAKAADPLERLEQVGEDLADILNRYANGNYAAVVTPANRGGGMVLQNMSLWERWERQSKEKLEAAKADAVLFDLEKQFDEAETAFRAFIEQHSAADEARAAARRKGHMDKKIEREAELADAEMRRAMDRSHEQLDKLMAVPAQTLDGLRVKVRAAECVYADCEIDTDCWNSVIADILRGIVV